MTAAPRSPAIRLIVGYKAVKGAAVLALALWLTLGGGAAVLWARHWIHQLSESGPLLAKLLHGVRSHLTAQMAGRAAIVAWADAGTTLLEGALLWMGKPWGEWLVVASLSVLVPFEVLGLVRHPGAGHVVVLAANVAVVAYLIWRRVHGGKDRGAPPGRTRIESYRRVHA